MAVRWCFDKSAVPAPDCPPHLPRSPPCPHALHIPTPCPLPPGTRPAVDSREPLHPEHKGSLLRARCLSAGRPPCDLRRPHPASPTLATLASSGDSSTSGAAGSRALSEELCLPRPESPCHRARHSQPVPPEGASLEMPASAGPRGSDRSHEHPRPALVIRLASARRPRGLRTVLSVHTHVGRTRLSHHEPHDTRFRDTRALRCHVAPA
jgi:hypothetical protein